jgi:hypothetical protein
MASSMIEQWYLTPVSFTALPMPVRVHMWFKDQGIRYAVVFRDNDHGQRFYEVREEKDLTPCAAAEAA